MGLDIQTDVPLAPLTTLGIGGPARLFVRAESDSAIEEALAFARDRGLDVFVLGGGSNILVADAGFDGLVIQVALKGIDPDSHGLVSVGAGEDWDAFVGYCVKDGLAGVECLSGIPGTVGGTPVQNVGAYGQEVSETIASVRCYDRAVRQFVDLSNAECGFAYRTSIFNTTERNRYVVLRVSFSMRTGGAAKIVYKDLIEHFAGRLPTLTEARDAVLAIRRAKSMVIDPADPNSRSAGSFFKNPIVSRRVFDQIAAEFPSAPSFDAGNGRVKVPAAWLIERAGFSKGFVLGKAGISANHSLALINLGGATAAEMIALKAAIQDAVRDRFAIELSPEPLLIGF